MKKLFRKIPFPVKLSLVGLLPLLFVAYMTFQVLAQQAEKIEVLTKFSQQLEQSSVLMKLIDNLQSERRYSFGFALNDKWQANMLSERNHTDEFINLVETDKSERFRGFKTYSLLDKLAAVRSQIDNRQMSAQDIMDFYSGAILRLNTLANISTENIPYLESLNKELRGQRILSQMITYMGIMRASYYNALYMRVEREKVPDMIRDDYNIYRSLENEFFYKSSLASISELNNAKEKTNIEITLSELETAVTGKAKLTTDAEHWWEISASAVDELKSLQRQLLSNVRDKAQIIYQNEKTNRDKNLIILILIIVIVILVVIYTIKNISDSLNELRDVSRKIAIGETGHHLRVYSSDVVGELTKSIMLIDSTNIELANAANEIGKGNFEVDLKPRSSSDLLGNAVAAMKTDLRKFTDENRDKLWLQAGLANVSDSTRGEKDLAELGKDSLNALATHIGAQTGLFYSTELHFLKLIAGHAIERISEVPESVNFGDTLIGQSAKDKKFLQLTGVPDQFVKIVSGSGNTVPTNLLIFPLVVNNQVEGVIELASIEPFGKLALQLVEMAAPGIGISLQAAKNRAKLQELLEETQTQSEELKMQHSELENMNAELEAHTEKLQVSEEELRVQQEELQQTNEELEEGSQLLKEKNMEVQRKAEELEAATRYKSEFLANMSHELRTPLNSILLLSRLLAENSDNHLNAEEIEYAQVIQSSGQGLLGMIDEILDLSKIEAGKMQIEHIETGLAEMADEMHKLFRNIAQEKQIEFNIKMEQKLPETIKTDKIRVEQILKNLISNAIKFTSKGGVSLEISRYSPTTLAFAVQDSGIGIPKDKQQLIFDAFQQADGSTKRKYGGTGLGLSISRELAKLLGGEITVTSVPGEGSRFTLYLPQSPQHVIQIQKQEEEEETAAVVENPYHSKTIPASIPDDRALITGHDKVILIIEDDTNFAKSLLEYTRKKGYKGIVAVRGDEGLELAAQFKPLGILLDIELPVKSGFEVMDLIKKDRSLRHIPVHMMSSHKLKNESLMKGAIDFINKPMAFEQMTEIFEKIEHVLGRKSKKVLIIEDNPKHARALSYFLENSNIESISKKNITEGAKALESNEIDCVILDMGIPDIRSYEILEEAKNKPGLGRIPIIVFTGKSLSKNEEARINKYSDTIVVKTAHSYQRVLDEISLFLHIVEENKENGTKKTSSKPDQLSDVLAGRNILIVDDDVRNIFSLSKSLEIYNMNVLTASDGKDALDMLEKNPHIDVVLLDMMMPRMDGYETASAIRQNALWRNLPVIAVTAKAMTGDREKCISAGASDYITKPVDIDQLTSLLRVWLYEKRTNTGK